jgi:hypothetical protein
MVKNLVMVVTLRPRCAGGQLSKLTVIITVRDGCAWDSTPVASRAWLVGPLRRAPGAKASRSVVPRALRCDAARPASAGHTIQRTPRSAAQRPSARKRRTARIVCAGGEPGPGSVHARHGAGDQPGGLELVAERFNVAAFLPDNGRELVHR